MGPVRGKTFDLFWISPKSQKAKLAIGGEVLQYSFKSVPGPEISQLQRSCVSVTVQLLS